MNKNIVMTSIERFGVSNYFKTNEFKEKAKETSLEKYGTEYPMKSEEIKERLSNVFQEKYGVSWPMENKDILDKRIETNKERYGGNGWGSEYIKQKCEKTCLEKYGFSNPMQSDEIKERLRIIVKDKYGVEWFCMHPDARKNSTNVSHANKAFAELLQNNGLSYETEFNIGNKSFDFKVGNTLIEINPSPTHNIDWTPYDKARGLPESYHIDKTLLANNSSYRCIHVWDWDNWQEIINMIKPRKRIFARNCEVKETGLLELFDLVDNNSYFQGSFDYGLTLSYKGKIVSCMTFLQWTKDCWEVNNFVSPKYSIVGGSEKLFKHFVENVNPKIVIGYSDTDKFQNGLFDNLGFERTDITTNKYFYNTKEKQVYLSKPAIINGNVVEIVGTKTIKYQINL